MSGLRILAYSPFMPYPPDHGGRIRTYLLLRELARAGHTVHLIPLIESRDEARHADALRSDGIDVHPILHERRFGRLTGGDRIRKARNLVTGHSDVLARFAASAATNAAAGIGGETWDVVLAELLWTAPLALETNGHAHVLDAHNVEWVIAARTAARTAGLGRWPAKAEARGLWRDERRLARRFDAIVAVSETDRDALADLAPSVPIDVVGNCVDTDRMLPQPVVETDAPVCLFMGSTNYPPNREAILRFAREIFPRITETAPGARFLAVGADPSPDVRALNAIDGVEILGYVDDLVEVYRQATTVVVPLSVGGGTRTKILEAMAYGRPVVSTSIGCEGFDVTSDRELVIADDNEAFARAVVRLHERPDCHRQVAERGRAFVEAHGSARRAGALFADALHRASKMGTRE